MEEELEVWWKSLRFPQYFITIYLFLFLLLYLSIIIILLALDFILFLLKINILLENIFMYNSIIKCNNF